MNSLQPTLNFIKTVLNTINLVGDQLLQPVMCVICANLKLYANQQNHLTRHLEGNIEKAHYIVSSLLVEWCGWMDGWKYGLGRDGNQGNNGLDSREGGWMIWAKSCLLGFFKF